jgi:nitrous oxide reductase accessory protein NosL
MTDNNKQTAIEPEEEQLFYEEPPRSTMRENLGMLFALLSLCIIGFAGYVWLTPGLEFADYLNGGAGQKLADDSSAAAQAEHAGHDMAAMGDEVRCPVCNMFALRSQSAIMASWSDGTETHHDSWDCVANWARDESLQLSSAEVVAYTEAEGDAIWLNAEAAGYRFGTSVSVRGSMPPNVAAFASADEAESAADMGGDVLTYSSLLQNLGILTTQSQASAAAASDSPDEMAGMDHPKDADGAAPEMQADSADPVSEGSQQLAGKLIEQAAFTDSSCPVCGMFADRSLTHVVVRWSDGSYSQHDCFDCAFGMLAEGGKLIDRIEVSLYDYDNPGSRWKDARLASFLYGTSRIKGSMPPFVAAFADSGEASAALPELGGEQLNFEELAARWQQ